MFVAHADEQHFDHVRFDIGLKTPGKGSRGDYSVFGKVSRP